MRNGRHRASRPNAVRVSLTPGTSVLGLMAAAVEKKVRAGAGLISSRDFLWPDYRLTPALVHPSGDGSAHVPGRGRSSRRG
ncbi:MAG: hypothetical protein ABSG19_01240 [Candidatus Aminicenantales bacterium]